MTAANNSSEEAKAAPPVTPPRLDLVEGLAARLAAARLEALSGVTVPEGGGDEQPMEEDDQKKEEKDAEEEKQKTSCSSAAATAAAASAALRRLGTLLGCGASPSDDRALPLAAASAAAARRLARSLPEGLEGARALPPRGAFAPEQLARLRDVDAALREEYRLRRRLLAGRAEVTLRALLASPRLLAEDNSEGKGLLAATTRAAEEALGRMGDEPAVEAGIEERCEEGEGGGVGVWGITAGDILSFGAATTRVAPKAAAATGRRPPGAGSAEEDSSTVAVAKRVVVAAVPDRGGRVNEPRGGGGGKGGGGAAAAAAGPAWTERVVGGGGGGGGWKHHQGKKHKKK